MQALNLECVMLYAMFLQRHPQLLFRHLKREERQLRRNALHLPLPKPQAWLIKSIVAII